MTVRVLAVALLCTLALAAGAADKPDRAWRWETSERLRARYDSTLAAQRRATARCAEKCENLFVVDGQRNPELLLPAELMDTLSGAFDAPDAQTRLRARELWLSRVPDLNLSDSFWDELYGTGRDFFAAWQQYHALGVSSEQAEPAERDRLATERQVLYESICAKRARALAAARERFGRDHFDQFLYRAIAPGLLVTEAGAGEANALWTEKGCE